MSGTLDEGLHVLVPGAGDEFPKRVKFGELGLVVGVGDAAGSQTVAEGDGHIVLGEDVADVVKMLVDKALLIVDEAPFTDDAAAAAHDAAETLVGQMHIFEAHAGVNGEVVHTLLALLNERVLEDFPRQVTHLAVHLLKGLVDRHRADGYRTVADDPLAGLVDVGAGREVHQGVAAPFAAPHGLVNLLLNGGGSGGVADVGVDFHEEVAPNDHRLALRVVDVGGQHGASGSNLVAHKLRGDVRVNA